MFEEEESETSKQQDGEGGAHSRIPKLKNSQSKKKVESIKPSRAISPHLNKAHSAQAPDVPSVFINFTPKKHSPAQETKYSHTASAQSKIPVRNKSTMGRPVTSTPSTMNYSSNHEGGKSNEGTHNTEEKLKA